MTPTLILTVGLPRSGKSTWASEQGAPIVSPDAIRLALHGKPFLPDAEHMVWTQAHYMVRALFRAGHHTVILDATNLTAMRRQEWLSDEWRTLYHVVDTPAHVCVERAIATGRPELVPVIDRMHRSSEPLDSGAVTV